MKPLVLALLCAALSCFAMAQVPQQPAAAGGIQPNDTAQLNSLLLQLDQASRSAMADLSRLRVDKWKTNSDNKQQVQSNVESLQRNLAAALPEIENRVRIAPQDMAANFKLYRNLNALYDVFASVAESAGAFGPKEHYEPLAQQAAVFDQIRRAFADRIEQLATAKEVELSRLRNAARAAQQQATQAPKKIVVDDNEPARKPKKKKSSTTPPS